MLVQHPAPAARALRPQLSFSKKDWRHDQVTHWFIIEYNLSCSG
ncbi:MAG: hypothetical protein OSB18_12880 [SAR324 cluster bacterium]|nr:hypothetical protein [SAR324 cluster bacterium]